MRIFLFILIFFALLLTLFKSGLGSVSERVDTDADDGMMEYLLVTENSISHPGTGRQIVVDLDDDGISDFLTVYPTANREDNIRPFITFSDIYFTDVGKQTNFEDAERINAYPFDLNGDGRKEILVNKLRHDSLFIEILSSSGRKTGRCFFLISGSPRPGYQWECHATPMEWRCQAGDTSLIFSLFTGYSYQPRGIVRVRYPSGEIVDAQRVLLTVKNTLNMIRCKRERENGLRVDLERYGMIGVSPAMQRVFALIDALAPTNAPVLITGESGTGKELAARALHNLSRRKDDPFVQINCAAIPDTLVESELFGYERGAFTDARQAKKGRFQLAQNGTLFLDEIGDLSLIAQSKILLALEQQEVTPLGGGKSEKLDVRFIFATNQDLEKMLAEGRFRQDLFYRINVASITLVPLRERREDIVPMAEYFLQRFEEIYPGTPKTLTDDGKSYLLSMAWEGNVQQIRNVMEKISILSNADQITARLLKNILEYKGQELNQPSPTHETLHSARDNFERTYIQSILNELNGNVQQTAAVLGLNRSHLYRKLEQLGIEIGKPPGAG